MNEVVEVKLNLQWSLQNTGESNIVCVTFVEEISRHCIEADQKWEVIIAAGNGTQRLTLINYIGAQLFKKGFL